MVFKRSVEICKEEKYILHQRFLSNPSPENEETYK